ncbi:MAG: hypothetical protein RR962_04260 [Hafnia sp.]
MLKTLKFIFFTIVMLGVNFKCNADWFVQLTRQSYEAPVGIAMYAQLTGVDFNETKPNPCYMRSECFIAGFVIDKSWLPDGRSNYGTTDKENLALRQKLAYSAKTMGELATALNKNNILYVPQSDYLPKEKGNDPTFCMFAAVGSFGELQVGTLVSNCADAVIAPPSCSLSSVDIDFGTLVESQVQWAISKYYSLYVRCDKETDVILSISNSYIPMNGNVNYKAWIDFGAGFGANLKLKKVKNQYVVRVRSRLDGAFKAGDYVGSTVILMELL